MNCISKNIFLLFILNLLLFFSAKSQLINLPIDQNSPLFIEEEYQSNFENHTVIRPLMMDLSKLEQKYDSCFSIKSEKKISKWLLTKDLISFKRNQYGFKVNPILSNMFSFYENNYFAENGLNLLFWSGKKMAGYFQYSSILANSNYYSDSNQTDIIPHFGKSNNTFLELKPYHNFSGYLSWQVADFMNLQVGRDKVFFGDGYRSLFVSDNSNAYPFFKGTVDIWKVKYTILYSCFREKDSLTATNFNAKKYSASHILSWNIGKRLNFNMFETVIWRGRDSLGNRGFDVNYLNPIIFYRPVEFSLGSPDNVIMGFGGRLRIFKTTHLYGQFLLDEFKLSELKAKTGWWGNKFGIQGGIKTYRLFGIKNLYALGEVNIVKPFTYSHGSYMENNGNYGQPLAHPLGANFAEGIANIRYEKKRWSVNSFIKIIEYGADYDTLNVGNNIYRSYDDNRNEYGNKFLQGAKHKMNVFEISIKYLINPRWMLSAQLGYRFINEQYQHYPNNNYITINSSSIFFGLYTHIGNREGLY